MNSSQNIHDKAKLILSTTLPIHFASYKKKVRKHTVNVQVKIELLSLVWQTPSGLVHAHYQPKHRPLLFLHSFCSLHGYIQIVFNHLIVIDFWMNLCHSSIVSIIHYDCIYCNLKMLLLVVSRLSSLNAHETHL